uniref:Uncharacterized protein n=1 Tax=Craspedostauros australis TaxID=1486917 RepID=A0A7R9ZTM4_9STRA
MRHGVEQKGGRVRSTPTHEERARVLIERWLVAAIILLRDVHTLATLCILVGNWRATRSNGNRGDGVSILHDAPYKIGKDSWLVMSHESCDVFSRQRNEGSPPLHFIPFH